MNTITLAMARAFFASAWADLKESQGISFSGVEITDVMPLDIDPAAISEAEQLFNEIGHLYAEDCGITQETWGHYAAMEAMGHGVGLYDYNINIDVPYHEFSMYSLTNEY